MFAPLLLAFVEKSSCSASALPRSREYLEKHLREKVLELCLGELGDYGDLLDFLLCEFFPEFRAPCLEFQRGLGRPLIEFLPEAELRALDTRLLAVLEFVNGLYDLRPEWWMLRESLQGKV